MPDTSDSKNTNKPVRDRSATERRIFDAGRALLAEEGFQNFGVNAVARRAGCDKQLIYRYFGGLDGLVEAIGADLASWVAAHVPEDTGGRFILTYGDLIERLLELYSRALRDDPLMMRILAWEVSDSSPHIRRMAEARAKGIAAWIEKMQGNMVSPKGVDTVAINAALLAAAEHLVLAITANGVASGLAVKKAKDWEKVEGALSRLARGAYG